MSNALKGRLFTCSNEAEREEERDPSEKIEIQASWERRREWNCANAVILRGKSNGVHMSMWV